MTPRTFTALGAAAIVSLLLAALVHASANSWIERLPGGAKLFPALAREAERVSSVALKRGDDSLTLVKAGEGWQVKDKGGYPATTSKVRELMLKLASAEMLEPKTRNPDRFQLLDVDDPSHKGTNAVDVSLSDAKGSPVADVIVGKHASEQLGTGKTGTYVRRPSDQQAWLSDVDLTVQPTFTSWIDTVVFETDTSKVSKIDIAVPGEPTLTVVREGAETKFVDPPKDQKLKTEGAAGYIIDAFSRLDLEDVRKPVEPPAGAPVSSATLTGAAGLTVTLTATGVGDDRWVRLVAAGAGDAKAEADKINARAKAWEYKIAGWKLDQIFKKRADLYEAAAPAAPPKPDGK